MFRKIASIFLPLLLPLPFAFADEPAEGETKPRAGHSHEGEAFNEGPRQFATIIPGTGDVHFPILSSWPDAQAFFDQGIGQLHGFWFFEAERTFRHIAAQDPDCAMAYWGMAMANWENAKRATEFIAKAVALKEKAGDAGKMWIDAQSAYLTSTEKDAKVKKRQLIRDLEKIVHAYPDDLEAKAFLACRIWQFGREGLPITSHESVDALIQQVFAKAPMHPAHHYRIHLWDEEKAERALDSAAKLAQTAPAIAHMWHMPGHIYSRLKRYDDSAWHQEASARVDHQRMFEQRILPDQIHNYAHNSEWLIRNLAFLGSGTKAVALSKSLLSNPRHPALNMPEKGNTSANYGRQRLIESLENFELWDEAISLSQTSYLDEGSNDSDKRQRLRLLGIAWFEKGDLAKLRDISVTVSNQRAAAEAEHELAQKTAREKAEEAKKNEKEVTQAVANAGKAPGEKVKQIKELQSDLDAYVAILEDRTDDARSALKDVKRSKPALARLHLRLGQQEEALRLSKEAVDGGKNQTLPLAARVEILHRCGQTDAAREAFSELKALSATVDLATPPFHRLSEIALEFGEQPDWRLPVVVRDDVGERPDLATLGPFDWTPPLAPDFSLPDGSGQPLGLGHYRGKPVVVLFYLGHGCLHCVEQLNAFAPKYGDFLKSGIEMIAVSSDLPEELKQSQEAYSEEGSFPFPLVADPTLDVFKAYRAHDDFENTPLHGTFLLDGEGHVLWQDIGPEPFSNPDFLIQEAKRLLQIHGHKA